MAASPLFIFSQQVAYGQRQTENGEEVSVAVVWCRCGHVLPGGIWYLCAEDKVLSVSTSKREKKVKMAYEEAIKNFKSSKGRYEDGIIRMEQVLGGRGESSIRRYC